VEGEDLVEMRLGGESSGGVGCLENEGAVGGPRRSGAIRIRFFCTLVYISNIKHNSRHTRHNPYMT
jgi:hypothetical protein